MGLDFSTDPRLSHSLSLYIAATFLRLLFDEIVDSIHDVSMQSVQVLISPDHRS